MIYCFIPHERKSSNPSPPCGALVECIPGTLDLDKGVRRAFSNGVRIQAEAIRKQKESDGEMVRCGEQVGERRKGQVSSLSSQEEEHGTSKSPQVGKGLTRSGSPFLFIEQEVLCVKLVHQPDLHGSYPLLCESALSSSHSISHSWATLLDIPFLRTAQHRADTVSGVMLLEKIQKLFLHASW